MKKLILAVSLFLSACLGPPPDRFSSPGRAANNPELPPASSANHNVANQSVMQRPPVESSQGGAAPGDLQFIDTMSVHHQAAIDMAKLVETRAMHPELKQLAAGIVEAQEREIARMSEVREKSFSGNTKAIDNNSPGMVHGMGGMDMQKLESLRGNEFDLEFLRQMIPHHEGAVEMAKDLQKRDAQPELKQMAGEIVTAQEAEIKQMREWLGQWQAK